MTFRFLEAIKELIEILIRKSRLLTGGLLILMVSLTCYDVVMRYVFNAGSVGMQEMEWHLFAAIFLMGGAYTLREDQHVRVDVFYRSEWFTERTRNRIDIFGTVFFLLPFCVVVIWTSAPFVYDAYLHGEMSPDPGGLKHRWIIKSLIPLGFFLLLLQGLLGIADRLSALCKEE